jgi:molybdopterin-binding protein
MLDVCVKEKSGIINKMEVSARNALKGTVKNIVVGSVNSEVTVEIVPGVEVTAIITKSSAENLNLTEGKQVYAIVKSSDVMIAID